MFQTVIYLKTFKIKKFILLFLFNFEELFSLFWRVKQNSWNPRDFGQNCLPAFAGDTLLGFVAVNFCWCFLEYLPAVIDICCSIVSDWIIIFCMHFINDWHLRLKSVRIVLLKSKKMRGGAAKMQKIISFLIKFYLPWTCNRLNMAIIMISLLAQGAKFIIL